MAIRERRKRAECSQGWLAGYVHVWLKGASLCIPDLNNQSWYFTASCPWLASWSFSLTQGFSMDYIGYLKLRYLKLIAHTLHYFVVPWKTAYLVYSCLSSFTVARSSEVQLCASFFAYLVFFNWQICILQTCPQELVLPRDAGHPGVHGWV